jgi:hypothetical protein
MKSLTIDTKKNCYVIDNNGMNNLQQNVANSITLDKGTFDIQIVSGVYSYAKCKTEGEPFVLLWIYGADGSTFINKNTGVETGATWTTLNGYKDKLQLEVKQKAVVCALFFDTNNKDNKGAATLSITSQQQYSAPRTLTVDAKKNCFVLDESYFSTLQEVGGNYIELEKGNYRVKIRESNATYWSGSGKQKFKLEPWALMWVNQGKFVSKLTGVEVEQSWCSLSGYQDEFVVEVKEKTTLTGLFFDTYKDDNEGSITLEINTLSQSELNQKYQERDRQWSQSGTSPTVIQEKVSVVGGGTEGGNVGINFNMEPFTFRFDQGQMEEMWKDFAAQIESSVNISDEKEKQKEKEVVTSWENLEKWLLQNSQSQAKKLSMQVTRVEFMMKTLTQQMEMAFQQNFQSWATYFNKNLNDLFVTRIPRIVNEQVNLRITEQTDEIKNLVIQQIQTQLDERVESLVDVKISNKTQEIKNSVVQQLQTELDRRVENTVNVKIANQSKEIETKVINQIQADIDKRIDNSVNVKIANQSKAIGNDVIQQIQADIDKRIDNVVNLKISDHTENVKNLVIQQMQTYIDQRIDNVVSLRVSNLAQDINTQVIRQIQGDFDRRISATVDLKLADQAHNIKSLTIAQIEAEFDNRMTTLINQSKDESVQLVVNNVVNDLDNRIDVNLQNKIVNFRNDISVLVKNEVNQNFAESVKTTILSDIKKQQFYVDMQSIKAEVENFYASLGQFETQLYLRIEQGDTQLYNWTLEQLIALQGCLTDRQALVDMFESFANKLKDELDGAECVNPNRFTPWVRTQPRIEGQRPQSLPRS